MEEFINNNYLNIDPADVEYAFDIKDFPNNDDEFWMEKALEHSPAAYKFLSDRLKKKKEFIEKALIDRGDEAVLAVQHFDQDLLNDESVMILAVRESTQCFQHASEALRDSKSLVMEMFGSCGMNGDSGFMYYMSDRLKDDEDVIMEGIRKFSSAYCYASSRLRKDLNFAMDALTMDNYYHGRKEIGNYMTDSIRKQMGFLLD